MLIAPRPTIRSLMPAPYIPSGSRPLAAPPGATQEGSRDSGPSRPSSGEALLPVLETLHFPTVFHIHITFYTLLGCNSTLPAKYFHAPSQPFCDRLTASDLLLSPGDRDEDCSSSCRVAGFLLSSPGIHFQTLVRWAGHGYWVCMLRHGGGLSSGPSIGWRGQL